MQFLERLIKHYRVAHLHIKIVLSSQNEEKNIFKQTVLYSCDQNPTLQGGRKAWRRDYWHGTVENNLLDYLFFFLQNVTNFNIKRLLHILVLWLRIRNNWYYLQKPAIIKRQGRKEKPCPIPPFCYFKFSLVCCIPQDMPITVWTSHIQLTLQTWPFLVHSCHGVTLRIKLVFYSEI